MFVFHADEYLNRPSRKINARGNSWYCQKNRELSKMQKMWRIVSRNLVGGQMYICGRIRIKKKGLSFRGYGSSLICAFLDRPMIPIFVLFCHARIIFDKEAESQETQIKERRRNPTTLLISKLLDETVRLSGARGTHFWTLRFSSFFSHFVFLQIFYH